MIVRKAKLRDIPQIVDMWVKLYKERDMTFHITDEDNQERCFYMLTQAITVDKAYVFVAEEEVNLVGYASGMIINYPYGFPTACSVHDIYIDPAHRNGRALKMLMAMAYKYGKDQGAEVAEIYSPPDKVERYKKMGFETVNTKMMKMIGGHYG